MHPFASGSSIVTLSRHPSGGAGTSGLGGGPGTTLAFTDADGNIITSVDGDGRQHEGGVTIVTSDSLVGTHFLDSHGQGGHGGVTKIEIDDDMDLGDMGGHGIGKMKGHKNIATDGEKKICLWPISNNQNDTSCGKTFTKMDSLKRHIAENHKGVRPFACSLCDKTYGRRDYLQRHLKSHNANYAVNLQSASNISASQVVQKVQVHQPHHSHHHSPSKNTIILQQGQGGTLQVVSSNSATHSSATQSGSGGSSGGSGHHQPSIPFLSLTNPLPQAHKPLGSKICRWVNNDGTVCGKAFSKLDSLRRHVNELHKGCRPFGCNMCDKNYGRRDYLDRHIRTHDPDNQKKNINKIDWGTSGILVTEDGQEIKRVIKKKRKDIPAEEKKICLWVLDDGTACGKTFTKFDSLKRHVSEAHKGVRPFSCTLCGKNYGRRDYLLRHLRSHNEAEVASISTTRLVGQNNQVSFKGVGHMVGVSGSGGLSLNQQSSSLGGSLSGLTGNSSGQIPLKLHSSKKRLSDKKTCRWVLDNGTICGRTFSKFDSLRRHVQELHKGVRPYICQLCEKSYGRRDYLDRHMKSHTSGGADIDPDDPMSDEDPHDDQDVKMNITGDNDATLNEVVTVVSADDDLTV